MSERIQARGRAPLCAAALVLVVAACNLIDHDPSLEARFVTTEKNDDYTISLVEGDAVASAPATNEGGNTRAVFWPAGAPPTSDQQSCTSWTETEHDLQPGVALRVRADADRTRTITVTKNVYAGIFWVFNVHTMDSGNTARPFTQIGQFAVAALFREDGSLAPGPWRLCARVVGDQLSLKVWASDEPEPAWMDGTHGGGVLLPAGWEAPGAAGWYAGHLRPATSLRYLGREVTELDTPEPPESTTTTETTVPESTTTTETTVPESTTTTETTVPDSTTTTDTTVPPPIDGASATARVAPGAAGPSTPTTVPYRQPTDLAIAP